MSNLVAVSSVCHLTTADRLTSTDRNFDFGVVFPGGSYIRPMMVYNPTGHDITFGIALSGSPIAGATVSCDHNVAPAGANQLVNVTLHIPADAVVEGDYAFEVDLTG